MTTEINFRRKSLTGILTLIPYCKRIALSQEVRSLMLWR